MPKHFYFSNFDLNGLTFYIISNSILFSIWRKKPLNPINPKGATFWNWAGWHGSRVASIGTGTSTSPSPGTEAGDSPEVSNLDAEPGDQRRCPGPCESPLQVHMWRAGEVMVAPGIARGQNENDSGGSLGSRADAIRTSRGTPVPGQQWGGQSPGT